MRTFDDVVRPFFEKNMEKRFTSLIFSTQHRIDRFLESARNGLEDSKNLEWGFEKVVKTKWIVWKE